MELITTMTSILVTGSEIRELSSEYVFNFFFEIVCCFNTGFFLYYEEDISKKVWHSNHQFVFLPEAKIFHKNTRSITNNYNLEKEYYIS